MITIQIPESRQAGSVDRFIESNRLTLVPPVKPEETMVLLEDDNVLGYAAYQRELAEAVVVILFIQPPSRGMGFGDGLLRGLLNLMERNGIQRFFIPGAAEMAGFLRGEGLSVCLEPPGWFQTPDAEPAWFEGTLPEFFQRPCKGGRK